MKYKNLRFRVATFDRFLKEADKYNNKLCIIEPGGVVDATPQKHKLSVYCNTPEAITCLDFKWSNSK